MTTSKLHLSSEAARYLRGLLDMWGRDELETAAQRAAYDALMGEDREFLPADLTAEEADGLRDLAESQDDGEALRLLSFEAAPPVSFHLSLAELRALGAGAPESPPNEMDLAYEKTESGAPGYVVEVPRETAEELVREALRRANRKAIPAPTREAARRAARKIERGLKKILGHKLRS